MPDIKHYGILGMKWGKRKGGGSVSVGRGVGGALREVGGLAKDAIKDDISKFKSIGARVKESASPSDDHVLSRQLKKKPISKLSNAELKKVITRLQLEKQLKDLDASSVGKGRGIVSRMLADLVAKGINAYARSKLDPNYVNIFTQMKEQARSKRD